MSPPLEHVQLADEQPAAGYREAPAASPEPSRAPRGRRLPVVAILALGAAITGVILLRTRRGAPTAITPKPSKAYVCEDGSDTITGRSIVVASGAAVTVKSGCDLRFVRCRIEGDVGINFQSGIAKVTLEDTTVTGRRAAVAMDQGGIQELHAARSTVRGPLRVEQGIFQGTGLIAFTPQEIPSFPSIAPLAAIGRAREASLLPKDARLVGFHAHFVGRGGLVDFGSKHYQSEILYTFEVALDALPPPPAPDLPPGVPPPPPPAIDRRELHTVKLTAEGMLPGRVKRERTFPQVTAPTEPRCSIADVWKKALAEGVHEAAVAQIRYWVDERENGRWEFEIRGTRTHYWIEDASCASRP